MVRPNVSSPSQLNVSLEAPVTDIPSLLRNAHELVERSWISSSQVPCSPYERNMAINCVHMGIVDIRGWNFRNMVAGKSLGPIFFRPGVPSRLSLIHNRTLSSPFTIYPSTNPHSLNVLITLPTLRRTSYSRFNARAPTLLDRVSTRGEPAWTGLGSMR